MHWNRSLNVEGCSGPARTRAIFGSYAKDLKSYAVDQSLPFKIL